ncbi:nucleoside monophosphate kinase [Candidatus Saccharibacteria bacterium]|nr:nucleoside monophosphate kinase [Candidatus Saccharibacteria bacterium]MBR3332348.1 nucleoside monophosphate kinase [Candidatus Saccharibacteria bacterium]
MIILFGLAGSGKGTQGKALAELFGWRTFSVGQVIRDTGEYTETVNAGKLIPDDDVIRLMNKQIEKAEAEGYDVILDGYPRDEYQARWMMENMAEKIDGAVILEVPKEELYERLALRGRDDDKDKEAIDRRFEVFEQNIYSILPLLEAKNIPYERVDGTGPINVVTDRLINVIKTMNPNATVQENDVNGGEIEKSYGE